MKKAIRRLTISKEIIRVLGDSDLKRPVGGELLLESGDNCTGVVALAVAAPSAVAGVIRG